MNRARRINARTAEELLNGAGVDAQHQRLAQVLRAVAGPTQPGELARRHDALAAFGHARLRPFPPQRRQSMIKTAVVKLLTVKAIAVGALLLGTGGVALAASTGALPNPLGNHPTPAASAGQSGSSHAPAASPHPTGSADPSPSLVGLCHAYTAGAGTAPGKALDNPAFHALVVAAGGKDNVDSYCTNLLATTTADPNGSPSDHPSRPAQHPPHRPTDHPPGRRTKHPPHQRPERPPHRKPQPQTLPLNRAPPRATARARDGAPQATARRDHVGR